MAERAKVIAEAFVGHVKLMAKVSGDGVGRCSMRCVGERDVATWLPVTWLPVTCLPATCCPLLFHVLLSQRPVIPAAQVPVVEAMTADTVLDNIFVFRACDLVEQQAIVRTLPSFLDENPQVCRFCLVSVFCCARAT
jgi:hypothetical protein